MELVFKILVTLIATAIWVFVVCWTWTRHIDVKQTAVGAVKKTVQQPVKWIATRDQNAIYQDGQLVGDVSGTVEIKGDQFGFAEICNTSGLKQNAPFEYRRFKLKIISIGTTMGLSSSAGGGRTEVKQNVLLDVLCEEVD